MRGKIFIIAFLLTASCTDEVSNKDFSVSKLYLEIHEDNIYKAPVENTDEILDENCWVLEDYWGSKKLTLVKRNLNSKDVGVKALCFLDSKNVICHEHFISGCGVGLAIYDTIKWNRKNDLISMNIEGGRIGYGDFNYHYTYKLVTENDSIIELVRIKD